MSRGRRTNKHHIDGVSENNWKDKRTGTIMAPGAVRNWPTTREEEFIKYLTSMVMLEAKEEAERQRKLRAERSDA